VKRQEIYGFFSGAAGVVAGCGSAAGVCVVVAGVAGTVSGEAGADGCDESGNGDCGAGAIGVVISERCISEPPPFPRCECSTARINVVANSAHAQ
jgi:hypothetical protein